MFLFLCLYVLYKKCSACDCGCVTASLCRFSGISSCLSVSNTKASLLMPFVLPLGFSISAARLALPDTGFISYGEMVDQGQQITQAVSIPVIGDGDNGYGNAMNVKRTVKGYIKAGFAGILLEDQVIVILLN